MLYLYSDESGNPTDDIWAIGTLITKEPNINASKIREIRAKYNYLHTEIKYSSSAYSQILPALRLFDYFLSSDMKYKIIINDKRFFKLSYFLNNTYNIRPEDLAYLTAYSSLIKTIKPSILEQSSKTLFYDNNHYVRKSDMKAFLQKKDSTLSNAQHKDSKEVDSENEYTDNALLLQLTDLLTGTILSLCFSKQAETSKQAKNIYRKELCVIFNGMLKAMKDKNHFYFPNFSTQKLNVFYWRKQ